MEKTPGPRLETLPLEVLGKIAQNLCFCRLCSGPPPELPRCDWGTINRCFPLSNYCLCPPDNLSIEEQSLNLSALSLTSRRIREGVLEYLYHRPATAKKWWLLARTALENPTLASLVRELVLPSEFEPPGSDDEIPESLKKYHRDRSLLAFTKPNGEVAVHRGLDALLPTDDDPLTTSDDELSLLATLFPNLRSIEAVMGKESITNDYDKTFHFNSPGSLSRLRNAELVFWEEEGGGLSLSRLAQYLFPAAPNLERLVVYALTDGPSDQPDRWSARKWVAATDIDREDDDGQGDGLRPNSAEDAPIVIAKLKELDLEYSCITPGMLQTILKMCPNLETFRYSSGGDRTGRYQFHQTEMRDVILRYKRKSLKRVETDFTSARECRDYCLRDDNWKVSLREDFGLQDDDGSEIFIPEFEQRGIKFRVVWFD